MVRRKTDEEFKGEIFSLVGRDYTFINPYISREVKLRVRHEICGTIYKVAPSGFLKGSRCTSCKDWILDRRLERQEEFKSKFSADYEIGCFEYRDSWIIAQVRHYKCGAIQLVRINSFEGVCSRCSKLEGISAKLPNGHTAIGFSERKDLRKYRNRVLIHHDACDKVYDAGEKAVYLGRGCPYCFSSIRLSQSEVSEQIHSISNGEYIVSGRYISRESPLELTHLSCGKKFISSRENFLKGNRCPNCIFSRGEKAVADVLDSLSIEYNREHTFEYLGRKRFDFFIPSLNIAIEYDGEQHFKAVDHWGGEEYLESVRQSDALKNDFCDFMGIDLLRIPYWEFDNVDEIVTNFIYTVKYMNAITNRKEA